MDDKTIKKFEDFFTNFKSQTYKKGELLIRADENPQGIFYLQQGYVKQYSISQKGDELIVNIFRPISFFPMSWAVNNTQNMYYFEAMTDLKTWKAPREKVIEYIKKEPNILYDLLCRVYKGTDGLLTRMIYLMAGNAYARLIAEIIITAKRFGGENGDSIKIKILEKDLAAQSGMTRETVSREVKILKDKKLVFLDKNILSIPSIKKLEEELGLL